MSEATSMTKAQAEALLGRKLDGTDANVIIAPARIREKRFNFSVDDKELKARAHVKWTKPESGKVLVADAKGEVIARFPDEASAEKHLAKAGFKPTDLVPPPPTKGKGKKAAAAK